MATQTDILPPRYRNPQRIGRGGMGEIYHATDTSLGRPVAIKILADRYAEDSLVRDRFTREALAAARLSGDPNTVTIFDVGEWNGRPFIVMEYLAGGSLEDVLRERGAQPPAQALEWLEQAARALDAAHSHRIVHRDVKPANLILNRDGDVHVADFGIASAMGMDSLTKPGTIMGTAGYLSPEQANGERATPASDRYALAVVAFELLSGSRPFENESPTAEAAAHVHAPIPSISARSQDLPEELDEVFERALAKDPDARYRSCAEFVGAIRGALAAAAGSTVALPAVAPAPAPRQSGRRLWPLAAAGLLAAAVAGAGLAAVLTDGGDRAAEPTTLPPSTVVRTVATTLPGTTEQVTVTATPPPAAATPVGGGEKGDDDKGDDDKGDEKGDGKEKVQGSVDEGIALTDQATGLMREGNYAEALALAQQALAMLRGSGHVYEAYANYDVGRSLAELGRCDEALPYLERRERLAGPHPDVTSAKRKCGA
jgi:eukaryotic-like serine/threonine-protein kinase